jgi:hyperosmotically inducible periplasmic protein
MKRLAVILTIASTMIPAAMMAKTTAPVPMTEAVRHKLAMLPRFGVFDNLTFRLDGGTVVLTGEVTRPILKDDAADAVRRVEGIAGVVNNIEVLPLSPYDDQVRVAVYRAIYGSPSLSVRYANRVQPAIHIIVKNGVVRLEGVVANAMDRDVANIRANGVFGVFQV